MPQQVPRSLAARWETELSTLSVSDQARPAMTCLVALLHTAEVMLEILGSKRTLWSRTDEIEQISYYFFARTYGLAYSAYVQLKDGFSIESQLQARGILESAIDLSYLWLCKEINGKPNDERAAWIKYQDVLRSKINRGWEAMRGHQEALGFEVSAPLASVQEQQGLEARELQYRSTFGRDEWALERDLLRRAQAVDRTMKLKDMGQFLEEDYQMVYRWTSQVMHGSSMGVNLYFSQTDNSVTIDFGPNPEDTGATAGMVGRFFLLVIRIVHHVVRLDFDLAKQITASGFSIHRTSGNNLV